MKNIIKHVNGDCNHEEPARGDEWIYKTTLGGRVIRGQGHMVLCPICSYQTILIDDK